LPASFRTTGGRSLDERHVWTRADHRWLKGRNKSRRFLILLILQASDAFFAPLAYKMV